MKFETLSSGKKRFWKRLSLGISLFAVVLVGVLTLCFSYAKYRNTESIELASGTVNFSLADFNLLAVNVKHVDEYGTLTGDYGREDVPIGNYKINGQSYCEVGQQKVYGSDSDNTVSVDYNGFSLTFSGVNKSNTKCYIYLDEFAPAKDMLAKLEAVKKSNYTIDKMPSPITGQYNADVENPEKKEKLYTSPDNYGVSYVFRGNNEDVNNWVNFAGHTWRIIRINGDGTLRMIFQCATTNCTTTEGATTNAVGGTAYKPAPYDDNTYVGYYYGTAHSDEKPTPPYDEVHSNATASNIATVVDNWYSGTGAMTNYTDYLDGSTGWCNDRVVVKGNWNNYNGDGTGQSASGYAPASRLIAKGGAWRKKQYPTLKCGVVMPETDPTEEEGFTSFDEIDAKAFKRDLFTTKNSGRGNEVLTNPVGLITSDEVAMAGGFGGTVGTNYWLYTNQYYWTMSPWSYDVDVKTASVFDVRTDGRFWGAGVGAAYGVRPVVNLKADTTFSGGNGKSSSPFVVALR